MSISSSRVAGNAGTPSAPVIRVEAGRRRYREPGRVGLEALPQRLDLVALGVVELPRVLAAGIVHSVCGHPLFVTRSARVMPMSAVRSRAGRAVRSSDLHDSSPGPPGRGGSGCRRPSAPVSSTSTGSSRRPRRCTPRRGRRCSTTYLRQRDGDGFTPFDLHDDYDRFVDGLPRADGVRTFLRSRGIELPEGEPRRPADGRDRQRAGQPQERHRPAADPPGRGRGLRGVGPATCTPCAPPGCAPPSSPRAPTRPRSCRSPG